MPTMDMEGGRVDQERSDGLIDFKHLVDLAQHSRGCQRR